ncbi:MAG: iron chelate uptake ABC transporter family permease subunit [Thermomicrobiales bacterium]|nr:iron chelate uptake ABC transporter family permease subunit [Thermomicrobiales bacterium]
MAVSLPVSSRINAVPRTVSWTPLVRLAVLILLLIIATVAFMTLESRGNWDFVLPFRGRKLAALVVVGCAVAISTVSFQTITSNRLLTPAIMGLDSLYMFVQALSVFFLGSATMIMIDPRVRFLIEILIMASFAGALFWWLFIRSRFDLHMILLVGVVFGILFRSLTGFVMRMIDPAEYIFLQDIFFASFGAVDRTLLGISAVLVMVGGLVVWRVQDRLDALLLGRPMAIGLGVDYQRTIALLFGVVVVMIAISTALVGPITFMGLIVSFLAYGLAGSWKHRYVLPASCIIACLLLIGGQTILERVFSYNTTLSIVIEFAGGIVFLILLFRGKYT